MNICPFWSNKKEQVSCFDDCAFATQNTENCPFKLYLNDNSALISKAIKSDKECLTPD